MNPEFWQNRWQENRIGFNQSEVNPLLIKYWSALNVPTGSRVFVPLCGKSIDMVWLVSQGYDVVGVELVESAVQAFFVEQNTQPTVHQHAKHSAIKYYQGKLEENGRTITLWVADIFALTSEDIGKIDAVYDKAALIALPADMRQKYSEQVRQLSVDKNNRAATQLLLTLNYDQSKKDGPPFSISHEQVQQYYGSHYEITELASVPASIGSMPELTVTEQVWSLSE